MKKKIFNGILLVAALFATSSAFVSCKDNDADEIANAKIAIQKDLNTQIADLKAQLDAVKASIPAAYNDTELRNKISDLTNKIADLEVLVKSIDAISEADAKTLISTQTSALKTEIDSQIADIQNQILLLAQALDKVVYSMVIEGTYNPIFGAIAAPVDVKSQVLAAYIGSDDMAEFHGKKIKKFYTGDAGTVYFTVNPNDRVLDGSFSMVNSIGETYNNVELSAAKKSDKVLTWGWNQTRANETGLYEVDVTVKDTKDIELDYKTIAKDIKNIISKRSQASVSALMSDLYPSLVGGKYQRMALKYDWSLTSGTSTLTGSSRSPYDLAVMAVKPLSYDFDVHIDKTPGIDKIYEIVERIFNKINIEFPTLDFSNVKFEIKSMDVGTRVIHVEANSGNGLPKSFDIPVSDLLQDFQDDQLANLNANMQNNLSDILKQIEEFNKVGVSFEKSKNDIAGEIIKYLKAFDSKFVNLVNNTNRALQPTLLVVSGGKIHRPGSVEAGEIILVPTSWTAEVFAPAFMKYIKVESGSDVVFEDVVDGTVKEIPLTAEAGKTYKVTYEAIDFFGKVRKKEYTIVAK